MCVFCLCIVFGLIVCLVDWSYCVIFCLWLHMDFLFNLRTAVG